MVLVDVRVGAESLPRGGVAPVRSPVRSCVRVLRACASRALRLFVPRGYPSSVTADYAAYQRWDLAQGLCTYMRSALCTRALLAAFGVGDAEASATAAVVVWLLRDGCGMLGGLLFASACGHSFDTQPKRWRLFADAANDVGLVCSLLAPLAPAHLFLPLVCAASVAGALCGVAAGATKAALTHHFARAGNAADVAAKEGSQETAVNLCGLVLGAWLAHATDRASLLALWSLFAALTLAHLWCNVLAMRALVLTSLTNDRLAYIAAEAFACARVPSPEAVARVEGAGLRRLSLRAWHVPASSACLRVGARHTTEAAALRHDADAALLAETLERALAARASARTALRSLPSGRGVVAESRACVALAWTDDERRRTCTTRRGALRCAAFLVDGAEHVDVLRAIALATLCAGAAATGRRGIVRTAQIELLDDLPAALERAGWDTRTVHVADAGWRIAVTRAPSEATPARAEAGAGTRSRVGASASRSPSRGRRP